MHSIAMSWNCGNAEVWGGVRPLFHIRLTFDGTTFSYWESIKVDQKLLVYYRINQLYNLNPVGD